jgi:hypothetical protein
MVRRLCTKQHPGYADFFALVSTLASDGTVARRARRSTRTLTIVPWSSTGYWMTSATHGPGAARPDLIATRGVRTRRPRWSASSGRSTANCAKALNAHRSRSGMHAGFIIAAKIQLPVQGQLAEPLEHCARLGVQVNNLERLRPGSLPRYMRDGTLAI